MFYNCFVDFREWITQRYIEWRGDAYGHEGTVTEFAAWIGVSQPLVSQWMAGSVPTSQKAITALVVRFGPEVYEVLGIENPSPIARVMHDTRAAYDSLPPDRQQAFIDRINKIIEDTYSDFNWKRKK